MGFAPRGELIEALNALIEVKRAGSRVAEAWRKGAVGSTGAFLLQLHADEARWCAMLTEHVRRLGGTPSRKTGGFRAKALAFEDDRSRLLFLNKGQGWVVRALDALTPRVRDESLRADLKRMRDAHLVNMASTEALLEAQDQPPPRA